MLRQGDGGGRAPLAPAPGLAELDALVAQAAGAGIEVKVAVEGEPRRLPSAVDLACYRVVQESLTNVVRHAGASQAEVTVTHHDGRVVVEVLDDGAAPSGNGAVGSGPGHPGHAGTGQGAGRQPRGRPPPRGRLPRPGQPPGGRPVSRVRRVAP